MIVGRLFSHPTVTAPGLFRWKLPKTLWGRFFGFWLGIPWPRFLECPSDAFLCLSCGMLWTVVDLDEAVRSARPAIRKDLGRAVKSSPRADELG